VVDVLGKFPLPVEVIRMALPLVQPRLKDLGLNPNLRQKKDGSGPLVTDEGNYILDCSWRRHPGARKSRRGAEEHRGRGGARAVPRHGVHGAGRG